MTSTESDRREYLDGGLRPLSCRDCGVHVLVKKLSPEQTSIQWTGPATTCPEIAARAAGGEHPAEIDTCPRLRSSIHRAIDEGRIPVPGETSESSEPQR
ncbi:hypothetical protein GCM10009854_19880 [Saccharopolyspora halophila]|uniref:Ferredoxin n=1 Tax=Saccharopolyspora halophila TaxID=405551 RepID=A0ABP5T0X6_9PSEU